MIEELHEVMANNRAQEQAAAAQPPPHMYQEILDDLIKPTDRSSPEKLLSEVRKTGIFDEQKERRYWVDEQNRNCFMWYAKALTINWVEDSRYWRWYPVRVTSQVSVDAAELLDVCWLEVQANFDTKYLTSGTEYEVSFVIMLKDPKYGWEEKVNFILTLPQRNEPTTRPFDMRKLPKGRWRYFRAGEFPTSPAQSGTMNFKLIQTVVKWKKGLVIMGVYIRPKI